MTKNTASEIITDYSSRSLVDLSYRRSVKIVGASGQGINTLGEIFSKSIKRSGQGVCAYREYPSLIKGGHATYQVDYAPEEVDANSVGVDVLVVLNRQATNWHLKEINEGGLIIHDIDNPRINTLEFELATSKNIKFKYIPALELAQEVKGNELTSNIVTLGYILMLCGVEYKLAEQVIRETFADKPQYVEIDVDCLNQGYKYDGQTKLGFRKRLIKSDEISDEDKQEIHNTATKPRELKRNEELSNRALLTGNHAIALGALNAGVRAHYAYPMTPSSSILNYLAEVQREYGILVKQAEGEITAAAMTIGSMHSGTRAMTATSGGGFDLMTEHLSLAAITEIPFVCVLASRPGPATGLPTWHSQGDLNLALYAGHGEFTRCILAPSSAESCFYMIGEAFNIAEQFQIPVILLTDKLLAESLYSMKEVDRSRVLINRGYTYPFNTDAKPVSNEDRYKINETGISKRWIPGSSEFNYNANSDEHTGSGDVTEEAAPAAEMIMKRIKKEKFLNDYLPEPELIFNEYPIKDAKGIIRIIGWGSTGTIVRDIFKYYDRKQIKVDYLNLERLWPFPTESIANYLKDSESPLILETNATGQLAELIKKETGIDIAHRLLKYDGRPFFLEEVIEYISENNLIKPNRNKHNF